MEKGQIRHVSVHCQGTKLLCYFTYASRRPGLEKVTLEICRKNQAINTYKENGGVISRIPYFSAIYKRSTSRSGRFVQRKQSLVTNQPNEERNNCSRRNPGRPVHRQRFINACLVLPLFCMKKYWHKFKSKWNNVVSNYIKNKTRYKRQKMHVYHKGRNTGLFALTSKSVRITLERTLRISVQV
jgi:hypothetical protein